jgi:hypothetical protein
MAYRFEPADYVVRINGKVRYRVRKLLKSNRDTIYKMYEFPKAINEKIYQCVSDKGATYYFRDEELESWK